MVDKWFPNHRTGQLAVDNQDELGECGMEFYGLTGLYTHNWWVTSNYSLMLMRQVPIIEDEIGIGWDGIVEELVEIVVVGMLHLTALHIPFMPQRYEWRREIYVMGQDVEGHQHIVCPRGVVLLLWL